MFKVDILDPDTWQSLCTPGTNCYGYIEPTFTIPRDYSWGTTYAIAKRVTAGSPPTPGGLEIQDFKVGK